MIATDMEAGAEVEWNYIWGRAILGVIVVWKKGVERKLEDPFREVRTMYPAYRGVVVEVSLLRWRSSDNPRRVKSWL